MIKIPIITIEQTQIDPKNVSDRDHTDVEEGLRTVTKDRTGKDEGHWILEMLVIIKGAFN